ncbi:MAG: hypothetical protein KF752_07605 [Pirellulaceae bacterium]|nr:hypothetical protein [Pirellulaceae bacterium]
MNRTITSAVGHGGVNNLQDAKVIQELLNQHIGKLTPLRPLTVDGRVGPNTIAAIVEFQKRIVKMSAPDGRVDPGGTTWRWLSANGPAPATSNVSGSAAVVYKDSLPSGERIVDPYCFDVIRLVMINAGCSKAVITSTIRTPEEQVDIMYRNAKINLAGQYALYGANGDAVLKVYENNKTKPEADVKKLMVDKVKELLKSGKRVSLHVTTPEAYKQKNIIDIGVNSTQAAAGTTFNKAKITAAFAKAKSDGYIKEFIDETNKSNNCWHVEIVPNAKPVPKSI